MQATPFPERHPEPPVLLSHVGGFDSVDDESINDSFIQHQAEGAGPFDYTARSNPSYSYWLYYMAENLKLINQLREKRGENSIYHNNCIQTWAVGPDGVAENVEVS